MTGSLPYFSSALAISEPYPALHPLCSTYVILLHSTSSFPNRQVESTCTTVATIDSRAPLSKFPVQQTSPVPFRVLVLQAASQPTSQLPSLPLTLCNTYIRTRLLDTARSRLRQTGLPRVSTEATQSRSSPVPNGNPPSSNRYDGGILQPLYAQRARKLSWRRGATRPVP